MNTDPEPPACVYQGFFETIRDVRRNRTLGTREIPDLPPGRILGNGHPIEFVLTENMELERGVRRVTVKASPRRPLLVSSSINRICGRAL